MLRGSHLPITPDPRDLTPFSGLCGPLHTCSIQSHRHRQTHTYTQVKIKIDLNVVLKKKKTMTIPNRWKQKFPRIINLNHLFFSNNSHITFYRKVIRQESRETRHLFHLAAWLGNDCIGLFVFLPQPFDLWTRIHSSWFVIAQKCLKDGDNIYGYWINVNQSFLFP